MSISVASSQKKSIWPGMKSVAKLYKKAIEIANEISVIIPGWRFLISGPANLRKGSPP